ncbi:guanylate kinase [Trichormus sp. NMC-1]|uniref:guanylate kinase n=1 Tax=Trichormus sp. NMC-1 TaxID=1853259 RepID=UPI0008DC1B1B|nr:guanylate kinase [Trichormus sp. NMC-1]
MQVLPIHSGATTKECQSPGKLIVLTGPSGVGKGTLMQALLQRHPELYYSVSVTTRSPRPGETNGKNYYFISRSKFEQLVAQGEFLEWAEFAGNYYGTPREAVLNHIQSGKLVVLEIELEGARQIRASFPSALSIFILPPTFSELEKRIRGRGQDSEESIARRLHCAQTEIQAADEFDIKIVNNDFETAVNEIEAVLFR